MKKILVCVGTRPNLIKITRLKECFSHYDDLSLQLLHTGQHYDYKMSEVFFEELGIPKPDVLFDLEGGSQVEVISEIMRKFEQHILQDRPDLVVVPGDVNSSFACAFVASRHDIPVAHIESGLRSFDMTMPEEVNRILIDNISDLFFVTEPSGVNNLLAEGKPKEKIVFTGNTMIDSLISFSEKINNSDILEKLGVIEKEYFVFTFHRPANVDNKENLRLLVDIVKDISKRSNVVFPIHPRTVKNIEEYGFKSELDDSNIVLCDPIGYLDFMKLISNSKGVITDSGGIQEETTFIGIPCLTIRPNTERPVTIDVGTNTLLDLDKSELMKYVLQIEEGTYKKGEIPENWDGKSSERIVEAISQYFR